MSIPCLTIVVPLEGEPRVQWICDTDSDERRLVNDLESRWAHVQIVLAAHTAIHDARQRLTAEAA